MIGAFALAATADDPTAARLFDSRGRMVGVVYRRPFGQWEVFLYASEGLRLTPETLPDLAAACRSWGAGVQSSRRGAPPPERPQ